MASLLIAMNVRGLMSVHARVPLCSSITLIRFQAEILLKFAEGLENKWVKCAWTLINPLTFIVISKDSKFYSYGLSIKLTVSVKVVHPTVYVLIFEASILCFWLIFMQWQGFWIWLFFKLVFIILECTLVKQHRKCTPLYRKHQLQGLNYVA